MGIKELMLDVDSERGKRLYTKMLRLLDSSTREIFDNAKDLVKSSGIHAGQTVLEIGCGSGYFTAAASEIIGKDGKLYSTDIHSLAIEETQKKVDRLGLDNVIVKMDNAMNSSFENSMFDVVLLYGVVPAPIISMDVISKEIFRILKPGGICAIWTKAPFWTPKAAIRSTPFENMKKIHGVFRLRKL